MLKLIPQQTDYWCGPASIQYLLQIVGRRVLSQKTLAKHLGTTQDGTNDYALARWLWKRGLYPKSNALTVPRPKGLKNRAWICYNVERDHWLVEYDGYYLDPEFGSRTKKPREKVNHRIIEIAW